ncbi:DUF4333 domain-containing protein [Pseudonocardia sp. WMMC193]|uniref:DUF4333 domain-containing protein n=1 Tax=Pseudonocardia sp. WMMC193 TaxID=2911965 RepID=UPI001F36D14B|nr:DUF4333 domain-containing protein [Pseudonocardia sp. WMMC193]MCF7548940.1 DUF4333 domain-containing protein [Pseudonocardia sp. WMMC193]
MSTPQDPHGGDRDWGRPPAGGWGAVGPSDPTADPPTPAFGTPAVEPQADPAGAESSRYGWDTPPSGSAPGAGGAGASAPAWADDGAAGWAAGGASDWDRRGSASGWDQEIAPSAWTGDTGSGAGGQVGWNPETGRAGATPAGWSPETGQGGQGGGQNAGPAGWDPQTGAQGAVPDGRDPRGGRAQQPGQPGGASPAGGWDPQRPGGGDPRDGSPESAAAATAALSATAPRGRSRPSEEGGRRGGRRLPLLIGAIVGVLVVAAVLVLGFWRPGFFVTEEFDRQALQTGVTQVLTQDYGLEVTALTCPDGQRVTAGSSFTCAATVDGENVTVPVTVLDDQGTYQVGRV